MERKLHGKNNPVYCYLAIPLRAHCWWFCSSHPWWGSAVCDNSGPPPLGRHHSACNPWRQRAYFNILPWLVEYTKKSNNKIFHICQCIWKNAISRIKSDLDIWSDLRWVHHFRACSTASEVRLWVSLMSMWVTLSLIWVKVNSCVSVTLCWYLRSILLQRSGSYTSWCHNLHTNEALCSKSHILNCLRM